MKGDAKQYTGWSIPSHGGSVTDMLVVTTTVRMVDGVHSNTTSTYNDVSQIPDMRHRERFESIPEG